MERSPPEDRDLAPTTAIPAVPAPPRARIEHGVLEPPPSAAHSVVVPEPHAYRFGNPLGYTLERFFAFVLDIVMVGYVVTSFAYAIIAINPLTGLPTNTEGGFDATLAIGLGVALVYVWLSEAFFNTTIWKLAFGLHVYPVRGGLVGVGRSLVRMLLRPVDLAVIGRVLALLPGHRRLGDLLGGTVVARSPLRGFAPLLGWIAIIVLVGLPWILVGPEKALAALFAFGEFVPRLAAAGWQSLLHLAGR